MSTGPRRTNLHSEAFDLGGARLVLDASCAINLLGTGAAESVLAAVPAAVLIEKHPFREVRRHPIEGRDHTSELDSLQRKGLLEVVSLSEAGNRIFRDSGAASLDLELDDGEAATIAYVVSEGESNVPVIDERKATRLFKERWPGRPIIDTVTLFHTLLQCQQHSSRATRDAVYSALLHARMQVAPSMRPWVVDLIGRQRASKCISLGPYRDSRTKM